MSLFSMHLQRKTAIFTAFTANPCAFAREHRISGKLAYIGNSPRSKFRGPSSLPLDTLKRCQYCLHIYINTKGLTMYEVKIEKDVPCPFTGKGLRNGVKYPEARMMDVGDSVYYPGSLFGSKDDLRRLVTAFARYANYSKKHFRQQYFEDGGVRIWRVR